MRIQTLTILIAAFFLCICINMCIYTYADACIEAFEKKEKKVKFHILHIPVEKDNDDDRLS